MSIIVGTNSYVNIADADTYFDSRMYTSAWDCAQTNEKESALIQATRELDLLFDWNGQIADEDQYLRFPRKYLYNCDGVELDDETIPQQIINATCEQAMYILKGDPTTKPGLLEKGFKRAKLDVMEVETDKLYRRDQIGQATITAVGCLGTVKAGATAGGFSNINAIRH